MLATRPLGTATLSGTVVDENDAVVPEASVLVKDSSKIIKREARTSRVGVFIITQLPPGNYTVSFMHGFRTSLTFHALLKQRPWMVARSQWRRAMHSW